MKLVFLSINLLLLSACSNDQQVGEHSENNISATSGSVRFNSTIHQIARQEGVDPKLVHAVIKQESNYDQNAISPAGAAGLMQLMPATAKDYGVLADERFNPVKNIRAGTRHLKMLMKQFNGNLPLVLAAYNAGQGNVIRYGHTIPPFKETQTYVRRVTNYYQASQRFSRQSTAQEFNPLSTAQRVNLISLNNEAKNGF